MVGVCSQVVGSWKRDLVEAVVMLGVNAVMEAWLRVVAPVGGM